MKIWRDKIHWATKPNDKIKRLIWFMFLIRTSQSDEWFTLHDTHTSQILVLHFERVWSLMWIESNWSFSWHQKYKVENSEFRWKKNTCQHYQRFSFGILLIVWQRKWMTSTFVIFVGIFCPSIFNVSTAHSLTVQRHFVFIALLSEQQKFSWKINCVNKIALCSNLNRLKDQHILTFSSKGSDFAVNKLWPIFANI